MGIYHPPPSNDMTNTMFIDEITEVLEGMIGRYTNMVIQGDLNMHVDDLTNANSYIFKYTMHAFGFKQHVTSPTHKCGLILDLRYSEVNSQLNLHNCKVHEFICDHALVTIDTTLNTAPLEPTEKISRDTTRLIKELLGKFYSTPVIDGNASLKQACDQLNEELQKMFNKAAPPKKVWYADRPKKTMVQQVYL